VFNPVLLTNFTVFCRLVTLALQNALLAIIMHYSRVSVAADKVYSASSAVLLNEILKGSISFTIAFLRTKPPQTSNGAYHYLPPTPNPANSFPPTGSATYLPRLQSLISQITSPDCWKLSIPALLYVLQNNLQFIAVSNLDVPTFQVTNQMKILTTAGFSVLLLKKRLNGWKWASLALLTIGVAIVQIQATSGSSGSHVPEAVAFPKGGASAEGNPTNEPVSNMPVMNPLKGFLAVFSACFTSGLAGVYFEMVLKGEQTS
jgi:solute carrier family 35 (UDP-sugar transporter), member A1/2/3